MRFIMLLFGVLAYFVQSPAAIAAGAKLVTVKSKRGVSQPFLFVMPDSPKAGVILFVGGDGVLKLSSSGQINEMENNFFSRTYDKFSDHGLMGTSKNAQMSPNRGSGRHPASGFWRSVAPERLI